MEHEEKAACLPFLRDCHCFNLRRATRAVTAFYNQHMKDTGITSQQFSVLRHIQRQSPVSVTELSDLMGVDRTTLSRNLALLEQRGLLAAKPSHGRQRMMTLTSDGEKTLAYAVTRWDTAQKEIEARLGTERITQLEQVLAVLLTEIYFFCNLSCIYTTERRFYDVYDE